MIVEHTETFVLSTELSLDTLLPEAGTDGVIIDLGECVTAVDAENCCEKPITACDATGAHCNTEVVHGCFVGNSDMIADATRP